METAKELADQYILDDNAGRERLEELFNVALQTAADKDGQIAALHKLIEAKTIDKAPLLIVKGVQMSEFRGMIKSLSQLKRVCPEMLQTMVMGLGEHQDIQSVTEEDLKRLGLGWIRTCPVVGCGRHDEHDHGGSQDEAKENTDPC